MKQTFREGEKVRVRGEKPGSINEFAIVKGIYDNGLYWISNMNMPFLGTITDIVTGEKIEKVRK